MPERVAIPLHPRGPGAESSMGDRGFGGADDAPRHKVSLKLLPSRHLARHLGAAALGNESLHCGGEPRPHLLADAGRVVHPVDPDPHRSSEPVTQRLVQEQLPVRPRSEHLRHRPFERRGIGGIHPGDDLERQCNVCRAARERPDVVEADRQVEHSVARHAAPRRLEPDAPVRLRREADAAPRVGAQSDVRQTSRGGHARA
eukprot:2674941-Prymnesium_polylepis.3